MLDIFPHTQHSFFAHNLLNLEILEETYRPVKFEYITSGREKRKYYEILKSQKLYSKME